MDQVHSTPAQTNEELAGVVGFGTTGRTLGWEEVRLKLATLNLLKLMLYVNTIEGRTAHNTIIRMASDELTDSLQYAVDGVVTREEVDRQRRPQRYDPHNHHLGPCVRSACRNCRTGDGCRYLHPYEWVIKCLSWMRLHRIK